MSAPLPDPGELLAEGSEVAGWRVTGPPRPEHGLVRVFPVARAEDGEARGRLTHFAGPAAQRQRELAQRARAAQEAAPEALCPFQLVERADGLAVILPEHPEWPAEQPTPAAEVVAALREAAGALGALHRAGLAHGELDPAALVRTPRGVRLLPPGLRPPPEELSALRVACDPLYAAPEVLDGRPATSSSDCYSLGLILLRLLSGKPPVGATDPLAGFLGRMSTPLPDLAQACPGASPGLASLYRHLCADYDARPRDAAAALELLEQAERRPLPPPEPRRVRVEEQRLGLALIAALLAGGALVVATTAAAVLRTPSALEGVPFTLPGAGGR